MEEMRQEILQLQRKLIEFERRQHGKVNYSHNNGLSEREDENPFYQDISSNEPMTHRFSIEYRGDISLGVKINLSKFKAHMNQNKFIEWFQIVERIFYYKDVSQDKKLS